MATIAEYGALWTLTDEAAQVMVEKDILFECPHSADHNIIEADKPVYHIREDKPDWIGVSTLPIAMAEAQSDVENAKRLPATIWIRPEDVHHQVMIMVQSDDPVVSWAWDMALREATKNFNGFRQINSPNNCDSSRSCDEHWTCPGMYGWELFGFHDVSFETIVESILAVAQVRALQLIKGW